MAVTSWILMLAEAEIARVGEATQASLPPPPEGAVWLECPLTSVALYDGEGNYSFGPVPVDVAAKKVALIREVNDRADATALLFITPGARQAMTYLRKESEARAWTAGADPADFPFITAEAASTGLTVEALVADIVASADLWEAVGAAIEANRRALIVSIEAAPTAEDLDTINIGAGWPS